MNCVHCGVKMHASCARDLQQPLNCLSCRSVMVVRRFGALELDQCNDCGAVWFDDGELEALKQLYISGQSPQWIEEQVEASVESESVEYESLTLGIMQTDKSKHVAKVSTQHIKSDDHSFYLPCPVCSKLMNRTNYMVNTGIIIHRCSNHGVWLSKETFDKLVTMLNEEDLHKLEQKQQLRKQAEKKARREKNKGDLVGHEDNSHLVRAIRFLEILFRI